MQLRKQINRPQRLEDEIAYGKSSNNPTKPAFPHLLQSQLVSFNPNLPAAAFPSRSSPKNRDDEDETEAGVEKDCDVDADSEKGYDTGDDECHPPSFHAKTRHIPTSSAPPGLCLEDDMATSDEDSGDVISGADGHDHFTVEYSGEGSIQPQASITNPLDWRNLRPAVQLAIISRMSESYARTKIYDLLGLYAQDFGRVKELVTRYNFQRKMEDHLIFWMQQDQLRGILRTDHTSTLRGAPEAYQEFQSESYMRKIREEVDESLLQATRAEVNLGKLFLAQRGIDRDMIGEWAHVSDGRYAARLFSDQIEMPTSPVPLGTGLDSGYVSVVVSPNGDPKAVEVDDDAALASQKKLKARDQTDSRSESRSRNMKNLQVHKTPVPVQVKLAQTHNLANSHTYSASPADDASAEYFGGRSRRNIRRSSRYDEAIAELTLNGSGRDGDSDYSVSDEGESAEEDEPPALLPRLRITSDNRIIGLPPAHPTSIVNPQTRNRRMLACSRNPQIQQTNATALSSCASPRTAPPTPLARVVVPPQKPKPKRKQSDPVPQASDDSRLNRFDRSLLGMSTEGNSFTDSLLAASEKASPHTTPWATPETKKTSQHAASSMMDQRGRSETVKAPAFSPISERNSRFSDPSRQGGITPVHTLPLSLHSKRVDLTTSDIITEGSSAGGSTSTRAAPKLHYGARNNQSIVVTETGSPVAIRQGLTTKLSFPETDTDHGNAIAPPLLPKRRTVPKSDSTPQSIHYDQIDPVTGTVMAPSLHPPRQALDPNTTPSPAPHPFKTPAPLTLHSAGEKLHKAAADLKSAATTITKTAATKPIQPHPSPLSSQLPPPLPSQTASSPPSSAPRRSRTKTAKAAVETTTPSQSASQSGDASQGGDLSESSKTSTCTKRKYAKSEAQKAKEAALREKRESEKRERETKMMSMKGRFGGGG